MDTKKLTSKGKKTTCKPRKLTDLFSSEIQDGSCYGDRDQHFAASQISLHQGLLSTPQHGIQHPRHAGLKQRLFGDTSPDSLRSRSPLKPRQHMEEQETQVGYTAETLAPESSPDPMANFPATDQLLTQAFLKDFMMSFRSMIHADFKLLSDQVAQLTIDTNDRVSKIESKMSDVTLAHNELVDAHEELKEEVRWLKEKMVDSEDRNRRNNVKIRGIAESVTTDGLKAHVKEIVKATLPGTPDAELIIDRAHRLPKPNFLPDRVPRDVIIRLHFYHVKEAFLAATRRGQKLPSPYQDLSLYSDLSQTTLQARREFVPVTATLRSHKIPYQWGFPTKLLIRRHGTISVLKTPKEGLDLLAQWNLQVINPKDARTSSDMEWSDKKEDEEKDKSPTASRGS